MATKPKRFIKGMRRQRPRVPVSGARPVRRVEPPALPTYQDIPVTSAMPERITADTVRPAVYDFQASRKIGGADPSRRAMYDAKGNLLVADGPVNINIIPYITTTDSVQVLDFNLTRRLLVVQNNGGAYLRFNLGSAAGLGIGMYLAAGVGYEFPIPTPQKLYIIGSIAGLNVTIMEGV